MNLLPVGVCAKRSCGNISDLYTRIYKVCGVSVYLYYYERVRDSNLPVTPLLSGRGGVDERFIGRGPHSMMETSAFCRLGNFGNFPVTELSVSIHSQFRILFVN